MSLIPFHATDRFVHQQCLGSGSFGSVHEVFDRDRQANVALKIPHEAAAKNLFLFKKEFRALADIRHPNLVNFHELIAENAQWFFTMELIDGIDILRYLRSHGIRDDAPTVPQTEPDLRENDGSDLAPASAPVNLHLVASSFRQLTLGLMAIHQAGLLHKDIKPSNVLVTREGRVVLLDFGLATELEASHMNPVDTAEVTGTPAYMAPEQLLDNKCTEASDWYSVGVLLYHVLTGRLPFQGNGLRILINKVSQHPSAPGQLIPGIPLELSELCMDLLTPSPGDRPGGVQVLQRLNVAKYDDDTTKPFTMPRDFIGRTREMETLIQAFHGLQSGQPGWINLHGGSGMGKSHLVRMFQREVRRQAPEALVLSGRCFEQEHVPYRALDGIVDELSQYLKHLPAARIEALLPRHTYALAQLFPVLRQVPRVMEFRRHQASNRDPQELRHRAFSALRELLCRLGMSLPLVLIIDDLQWGDADSAVLLTDLLSPPEAPRMLFVACFRTEESGTSPALREFLSLGRAALGRCTEIPLVELPPEEARQLARNLLGETACTTEERVDWVARESEGNPFFIHELAQHVHSLNLPDLPSNHLAAHLQARMAELPSEAQRLLQLVAIAGYPLEWLVLKEAASLTTSGIDSLDTLRQGHFIRSRAEQLQKIEPYHDFIRRAVLKSLATEAIQEGHLRLARTLEQAPSPEVQALALHFSAAGQTVKAIEYLTTAGLQAASSLAFAKAASMLRMSLNLRSSDDPDACGIWRCLGETLANGGRGKEAAEAYLQAATLAAPREAASLLRLAAQEFLRTGHLQEGAGALEGVLAFIGERLASTPTRSLLSAFYHQLLIHIRGLRVQERPPEQIAPFILDRLDAYWVITMGMATGDLMRVADFQAKQLLLSLRTGEPVRLVRALAYEAIFSSARGNRAAKRTQKFMNLALLYAEKIGDPSAMSQALVASGIAHTVLGHWRKGAEILDRAETVIREKTSGLTYELRNAQSYALINHYVLGNLTLICERLPALLREAEETGDLLFLVNLKTGSAFIRDLARNEPELARREIREVMGRLPPEGFFPQRYLELAALCNIGLYRGDFQETWAFLLKRWKELNQSRLMFVQSIRITTLELRARLALALASEAQEEPTRTRLLDQARRDTKALGREHIDYGSALALRLRAIEAGLTGRLEDAQGLAFLAETAFDACDMALHANIMKRGRGLLKCDSGGTLVREAEEWMQRQGIVTPARMTAMFLPGLNLG
jgi:serine/threonine protein kinase